MLKSLYFYFKLFLTFCFIAFGATIYVFYFYSKDLPDYSQLANYHPPSITRIYAANGKLMEEYAVERRVFVPIKHIPKSLIEAFVAAEDKNFFTHPGIDIISILRSVTSFTNIFQKRRMKGGSTITQQVVKNFLLDSEYSLARKIKEAILSYRISQVLTKSQILELYLNQSYLGRSAYGVAAAAQIYFNKSIDELNLPESAFLAGLPKAPSTFNPDKNYDKAKQRRDYVLGRMLEDGCISEEVASAAIASPIILRKRDENETIKAGYYSEKVRDEAIRLVNEDNFYQGGLTIITPLDETTQYQAEKSLRKGIRDYDRKQHGFLGAIANIDITNWQEKLKNVPKPLALLEYQLAVVLDVSDNDAQIGLQEDFTKVSINISGMNWARANLSSVKNLLKIGDVIVVEKLQPNKYALRQIPAVNGSIFVMNPTTGQVLASVGGYDFNASKFDRVTQALRQPGSLVKPFVYLAALENGITPNRIFDDAPVEIFQGPNMPIWKPKNYKGDFQGPITMRKALEKSRNPVTVRIMQAIGLNKVTEIITRFNINSEPQKIYSMVLGSLETTLEKMTTAFAMLANSGKEVTPHFIELIKDRNGQIIYKRDQRECIDCLVSADNISQNTIELPKISQTQSRMITDEANSYQITSFLTGVVERGTASSAKKLRKIIAGKTGTTNNSMDTWFVGFTPRIIVGTYIGYDTPKTLGKTATGSSVSLPIFIDFMENCYKEPSIPFKIPENIKFVPINPNNGKLDKNSQFMEAFKKTDPVIYNIENPINGQPEELDISKEIY